MKTADYAYAVARIRANELRLLSADDYEQLIACGSIDGIIRLLSEKGWQLNPQNPVVTCANEAESAWNLIEECASDSTLLEVLTVGNDFFNLKAALKAYFSDNNPDDYFIYPCICNPKLISEAVKTNNFSLLPSFLTETAKEAYDSLTELLDGQTAEMIIDKACFRALSHYAERSGSNIMKKISEFRIACADIKTALRCICNGKSKEFTSEAMVETRLFDCRALAECSSKEEIIEFLESTSLEFLNDSLKGGFSAFEDSCENHIAVLLRESKNDIYGPDPLIAYWFRKNNEIRNVRIIISAKENNLSSDEIRRRVRMDYV